MPGVGTSPWASHKPLRRERKLRNCSENSLSVKSGSVIKSIVTVRLAQSSASLTMASACFTAHLIMRFEAGQSPSTVKKLQVLRVLAPARAAAAKIFSDEPSPPGSHKQSTCGG